jgi:deoxyadenosine/deoxycytidine kinase
MSAKARAPRVAIVGPCTSGKSTLAQALRDVGYDARQPAQEHSYVPEMWQKLTQPDLLIYLDVDYENVVARRPKNPGNPQRLQEQNRRLAHARQHADLYLHTADLTAKQVREQVIRFLNSLAAE